MAWKRDRGRLFSEKQKDRIVEMLLEGKSKSDVGKVVGCHRSCLDYILKVRYGTVEVEVVRKKWEKESAPKPAPKPDKAKPQGLNDEQRYLLWALQGALNKVGGVSYVDRLIVDISSGRYE